MAANTNPIFSRVAQAEWGTITAANTAKDGTGTVTIIYTADATEGGRVDKVIAMPLGTNVATVLRIFINNGSSTTVAANNSMIAQKTMPATTNSEVAALTAQEIALDLALPPGYRLTATLGTAIAAGIAVTAEGGKY